jgi:hypothetical protein
MQDTDRSVAVTIGGKEYQLILTTKATKDIGEKYGGMEELTDKLLGAGDYALAIETVSWLVTLLANQSILRHNFANPGDQKEPLTQEAVELLTDPYELTTQFKDAIMEAFIKGTTRHVESEKGGEDEGNTGGG